MLASLFDPLYSLVGWLLAVLYVPTHNLGVSIVLLTLVVMAVQFPLIAKQTRSMIQMQRVQPEIKKIQQKYKDDRQKQNEELLKFYQENKINPLAGCLPLLLVLPIGIAVLGTFRHGVQDHIPKNGTFNKLYVDLCTFNGKLLGTDTKLLPPGAKADATNNCGKAISAHSPGSMHFLGMKLNLSAADAVSKGIGGAIPYLLLLGLVIFTGWYQVRQTQARQLRQGGPQPNAQMQAVTKVMPIFFGFISYGFNAATTVYFVISNAWRIGQQHFVLNKMYEEEHGAITTKAVETPPADQDGGSANGGKPSPNAARRKKKRKR